MSKKTTHKVGCRHCGKKMEVEVSVSEYQGVVTVATRQFGTRVRYPSGGLYVVNVFCYCSTACEEKKYSKTPIIEDGAGDA